MPRGGRRPTIAIAVTALALLAPTCALASGRDHSPTPAASAAKAQVLHYWTPERMREARPLELVRGAGGAAHLRLGLAAPAAPTASASFLAIPTPEEPPYSVNGRIFLKQGGLEGYCSGTAINTPTRQLVLTAGHCVNSGPSPDEGRPKIWSQYLEFVPAYTSGTAPFGAFVAKRGRVYAPKQWVKGGNPDFDMGAFLTQPNAEGVNVADAVGGVTIAMGLTRKQSFRTFGYPGTVKRMQGCNSHYAGDDPETYPFSGPPTMGVRCHWAPGASGGGWLIAGGTEINGINTYLHIDNASKTYSPYFTNETIGKLVRGL